VTESNNPVIRREITGLPKTPENTIKECDIKCVEALNYFLRKWNLEAILPTKLVHKEKVTDGAHYMMYEAPNTIIIDDLNEFVRYLITIRKTFQPDKKFWLAFLLENMTLIIATKPFDFNEEIAQVCNTKLEIEKFLEQKYGHGQHI
jgi:hypothetical protein